MRAIKEGDIVRIIYASSGISGNKYKVLHTPIDVGDLWYLEGVTTGEIKALNPSSSDFTSLEKEKEEEK